MTKIDSELFNRLNVEQFTGNQQAPVYGKGGMTNGLLASVEQQLGFDLPSDFRALLQNLRDPGGVFFPWSNFSLDEYNYSIEWILKGLEFDIEHNEVWLKRWGARPTDLALAKGYARSDFKSWPRLIPIYGHRFLPVDPCLPGNPVFSIWQTDIIYYGETLGDYLLREFIRSEKDKPLRSLIRRIPIWSDFVEETDGFLEDEL